MPMIKVVRGRNYSSSKRSIQDYNKGKTIDFGFSIKGQNKSFINSNRRFIRRNIKGNFKANDQRNKCLWKRKNKSDT